MGDSNPSYSIRQFDSSTNTLKYPPIWSEFGWMQTIIKHERKDFIKPNINLWGYRCEAFRLTWMHFIMKIDWVITKFLDKNVENILQFVDKMSYTPMNEIPTCFGFVGVNIGDHSNVFKRLNSQLQKRNNPQRQRRMIVLRSHECITVLHAINSIIYQMETNENEEDLELTKKYSDAPSSLSIAISKLEDWFRNYKFELEHVNGNFNPPPFIIMIVDAELFAHGVLDGTIKFCYFLRNEYKLPVSIIMGVSFSSHFIETLCEPETFRKMLIRELDIFNSRMVGSIIFDMLLFDPTLLPFIIPNQCIEVLEHFFTHHNLSVFTLIKHIYYICLDYFSSCPYSFLNRPLDHFFEQFDKKCSNNSLYDVRNLFRKIDLLLENTKSVLDHNYREISTNQAALILERKYSINLLLKFDDCLSKFQKEVGETVKKRDLTNMNEIQNGEYREISSIWLYRRAQTQPSISLDFFRVILRSLDSVAEYLSQIQKTSYEKINANLSTNHSTPKLYITLKIELETILSNYDTKENNIQQASRIKSWVKSYLHTLLHDNDLYCISRSFYFWNKSPQWLKDELNPQITHEYLHTLGNLLYSTRLIKSRTETIKNTSVDMKKVETPYNEIYYRKCSPLLFDLSFLYQIYEQSSNISSLWDWFTIFCEIQMGLTQRFHNGAQYDSDSAIATLHTRFALAIGTFESLVGLFSIYTYHGNSSFEMKISSQENISDRSYSIHSGLKKSRNTKRDTMITSRLSREETASFLTLKDQMSPFRVKKLHWGRILDEDYSHSIAEIVQKKRKPRN